MVVGILTFLHYVIISTQTTFYLFEFFMISVTFNERFVQFQAHVLGTYLPVTG